MRKKHNEKQLFCRGFSELLNGTITFLNLALLKKLIIYDLCSKIYKKSRLFPYLQQLERIQSSLNEESNETNASY